MGDQVKKTTLGLLNSVLVNDPEFVGDVIACVVSSLQESLSRSQLRANMLSHAFATMVAPRPMAFVRAIPKQQREVMLKALSETGLWEKEWYQKLEEALRGK